MGDNCKQKIFLVKMGKQSYLSLLIFCAVLSQGLAILSNGSIEESWRLHSRKKRVIDNTGAGGMPTQLSRARYIVNILKNGVSHCAGAILDDDIIITIPTCVTVIRGVTYTILTNSALRNGGTPHRIAMQIAEPYFGFAVVRIVPPIQLHLRLNEEIGLLLRAVPLDSYGYFTGWGATSVNHTNIDSFPKELRQTRLPIITHEECGPYMGHVRPIHHVCTFDISRRRAPGFGDEGGPLVYNNELLGILLKRGNPTWAEPDTYCGFNNPLLHHLIDISIDFVRMH